MNYYKTYTVAEAQKKLEHYCAYQERCHKEVEEKLKNMGMIPEARLQIVAHLIENNFLNETRFAELYVSGKFNIKHWGKIKIKSALKFKAISEYNIRHALKTIDEECYLNKLHSLVDKQLNLITEQNPSKKKQKIINYLQYRGWENHLIFDAINNAF